MLCKIKLEKKELIFDIKPEEIRNIEKGSGLIDYLRMNNYSNDETLAILKSSHNYLLCANGTVEKTFDYSN
ncbi:hypothetical protein H6A03_01190 [[Clostridium] spiroforme]|nr:hypothetical protein [Thomasclavelia spiroformis]